MGRYDIAKGKTSASVRINNEDRRFYENATFEIIAEKMPYYCLLLKMDKRDLNYSKSTEISLKITKLSDSNYRPCSLDAFIGKTIAFRLHNGPMIHVCVLNYSINCNGIEDKRAYLHDIEGVVVGEMNMRTSPTGRDIRNYNPPFQNFI